MDGAHPLAARRTDRRPMAHAWPPGTRSRAVNHAPALTLAAPPPRPPARGGGASRWPLGGWGERPGRFQLRLEGRAQTKGSPCLAPAAGPGGPRVEGRGQSGRQAAFLPSRVEPGRRASLLGSSRLAARRRCPGARAGRSPAAAAAATKGEAGGRCVAWRPGREAGHAAAARAWENPAFRGGKRGMRSFGRERAAGEKWVRVALVPSK